MSDKTLRESAVQCANACGLDPSRAAELIEIFGRECELGALATAVQRLESEGYIASAYADVIRDLIEERAQS